VLDAQLFRAADCNTGHYLADVRARLAESKQTMHRFHMEGFSLEKLNTLKGKEQFYMRPLSPWHSVSSGCEWRRRPPAMESSCEYVE
jgi:hypothetical protein